MAEQILKMEKITKKFTNTYALKGVDFFCNRGEVHCLAGENGAGKSTLLKILSGLFQQDQGEISILGEKVSFKKPQDAQKRGIAMVYQELTLIPDMTVAENIFLNIEPKKKVALVDKREMLNKLDELMEQYEIRLEADIPVKKLSVAHQQMTEILKILMRNPEIIILDEPTSALSETEVKKLFQIIRRMTELKKTIIFISHRMQEIFEISDRITVLKDGELVGTKDIHEMKETDLVKMMVGRNLNSIFPPTQALQSDITIFEVKNLSVTDKVKNISFQVKKGEIIGIAGLEGHGQTELLNGIAGILPKSKGGIFINNECVKTDYPWQAIKAGISLVPQDRKTEGLFLKLSVKKNLSIINQKTYKKRLFIEKRSEDLFVKNMVEKLSIKVGDFNEPVQNLSGGNQQKVVLGKELAINPRVLLFNDPTRGVDIEAKSEFYAIMRHLADKGVAIVMCSSDLLEIMGISDRVIVMYEGKISGILNKDEVHEESIMHYALGLG